ncbi:MAG: hypothetical protein IJN44_02095 [Clostridia bacterium]|nr:hypothetical protein [Clostridia bacterium]
MKLGKKSWLLILMVIVMCVSTLGGTFAWFTDEVTTTSNIVESGNLDAKMQWADGKQSPASASWKDASQGAIFEYALWEPGYTQVRHLHVKNAGNLAFKYQLSIAAGAEVSSLSDVIDVYVISPAKAISGRTDLTGLSPVGTLTDVLAGLRLTGSENFLLSGQETNLTIALKMQEEAGNEYQNLSIGSDFAVQLLATQYAYEEDSFGSDYDENAVFSANFMYFSAYAAVPGVDGNNCMTNPVTVGEAADPVQATVPAGVKLEEGADALVLQVDRNVGSSAVISRAYDDTVYTLDVHIDGVDKGNTKPITVFLRGILPAGLKDTSVALYHVEAGEAKKMKAVDTFTAHNQYHYDAATGDVTIYVASFSEFITRVAASDPWNGDVKTEWYTQNPSALTFEISNEEELAGLGQLVAAGNDFAGKTIRLTANLDLGGTTQDRTFYPIGYNSETYEVHPFKGIFDGQGYAIDDLYQNTWNIKGNYSGSYYNESLGLFALIEGGTVRNLVLDHFKMEGEFAPTGCVAGCAKGGTFENITVFSSNPATYNTGVGGIIGWDESDGATYTFNNITIDSSNTISALWGTYDAACGGIMGYLSESSTATFNNCEIGAVMDVYNDVCGNYQYYQYRYSGMLVGTVGDDGDPDSSRIHCTNCNVYLGSWRFNYYCEFEKNSQASYTDDYQFSRVPLSELVIENGKVVGCKPEIHQHTAKEDKQAVYLPFSQLYTGYGWGANAVYQHDGVKVQEYVYSVTYMDGIDDVLGVDYVKDNSKAFSITHKAKKDGKTFGGWVNLDSEKTTAIAADNVLNVKLYTTWANEYIARFVDQNGSLIFETTIVNGTLTQTPPAPPAAEGFTVTWGMGDYMDVIRSATSDVTIRAVYTYNGYLNLLPVDEDGDGIIDYYRLLATAGLENDKSNLVIPGYVGGLAIREIDFLVPNQENGNKFNGLKKVTFEEGVEELWSYCLASTPSVSEFSFPNSLKLIQKNVFTETDGSSNGNKSFTIHYNGTKDEWGKITKEEGWLNGIGNKGLTIVCKDNVTFTETP